MTLFKKNCQNSCLQIYNRVMLLLSHVLPGDSGKCFIKDVLPHRGWFCFFLRLEQKFWKRIPLWNSVLVMEFLLNDFFFLVSSYGDLCFKGPWGNLKRSTEKNQNLKKDQLKKIFFLYGRVSLSWHWRYFGSNNSFHANSIPNPSVTTKSISRYCQMLLWGKISGWKTTALWDFQHLSINYIWREIIY